MDKHDHGHCCSGNLSTPSVHQTLDELEFERGIWSAALNGEDDKIKQHLSKGVNPNILDSSGYAPLHYASRNGHLKICEILLDSLANVNIPTKSGLSTPLHRAAMRGHKDIVKLLLSRGAKPDMNDADGKTPLHKAAEGRHTGVCQLLIKKCPQMKNTLDNKNRKAKDYVTEDDKDLYDLLS